MQFEITPEQQARIDQWLMETVYPPIVAEQREAHRQAGNVATFAFYDWEAGIPYQGASGGAVTYQFTPTSIGVVLKVEAYGQTLNLTDYESW
jgi:hypothetical protein